MAKKDALMLGGAALRGGQDLAVMGLSFVCREGLARRVLHQTLDSEYLRLPKFSFAAARRHVHGCTQVITVRATVSRDQTRELHAAKEERLALCTVIWGAIRWDESAAVTGGPSFHNHVAW
ncbi:hypothetical protein CCUS01_06821 [Colletotrichum cuscutae]|uniref:Uncharacterized protein n=1 Tax=Colletotrichum cuscutae TaxID=1209917 RepID=A0AAI9UZR7_9PEZI|nr:hypothetical protein CCUS01_06821 [Colletotrichum cuscutae]